MDTAMKLEGTYQPMGFGGAFTRQFRFLWTSRRPLLLFVGLAGILALAGEPWTDNPLARLLTIWPVWLIFVGPIWGFAVFHNEGPGSRHYHWSQPVARDVHSLARVAAGLAWLWLLYALLIVVALVIGGLDGDLWQFTEVGLAGWVNYFTAPLIGYLAISLLTIPSDYPIRWFLGIIFLFPILVSLLDEWATLESLVRTLLKPLSHPAWGLGITIIGPLGVSVSRIHGLLQPEIGQGGPDFDLGVWWLATTFWVLLLAAVVWALARRHPDTLPRWRRSG
jgi:hypothetical protein